MGEPGDRWAGYESRPTMLASSSISLAPRSASLLDQEVQPLALGLAIKLMFPLSSIL
jgi:hypothetical protein